MAKKEFTQKEEQIARYMKAMGHPVRVAILNFLAEQKSCFFGDIHDVIPMAKATVSQHLTELKEAGLIQGEIIPPKVKYCINKENWETAKQMLSNFMNQVETNKTTCCS